MTKRLPSMVYREKISSIQLVNVTPLDITQRFEFSDKAETFWRFGYETIAGEEGWFAWTRRANSEEYFCIGRISEVELIKRLETIPPALTQDDFIDLELWMKTGGLAQYAPKKRRRRKSKEVEDATGE